MKLLKEKLILNEEDDITKIDLDDFETAINTPGVWGVVESGDDCRLFATEMEARNYFNNYNLDNLPNDCDGLELFVVNAKGDAETIDFRLRDYGYNESIKKAKVCKKCNKALVEDDIEELPVAKMEEPIVVSTEEETIEEPAQDVVNNAYARIINDAIQSKWYNIDNLKSIITTIDSGEYGYLQSSEEVVAILNEIIDQETVTIGMLTKASELIDDTNNDLMKQGEEKAEEIIDNVGEETIEVETKEEEVDEG